VAIMKHDFRTAGSKLAVVMNDLSEWTTKHLCTSPICYVVNGIFQYLADVQGDIKACGTDFKNAYNDFGDAFHDIVALKPRFHFIKNRTSLHAGIAAIGKGLAAVASSVKDCHMVELAAIIDKLAVELGIIPEIKWVEELITILIKAVPIERELSSACQAWSTHNWPSFGYNLIMLIKTLIMPVHTVGNASTIANEFVDGPENTLVGLGCKGSADPTGPFPMCYQGSAGALGLKETVKVRIDAYANGKGTMDLQGSGIAAFTCMGKSFTKSGQQIDLDVSADLPAELTVKKVLYCSNTDTISVTVKDTHVPLPVSATLKKVACGATTVVV